MSRARQLGVAFAVWTATCLISLAAVANDVDPWFGTDKALHFGASAVLAGGGYALGTGLSQDRWKAFALGGGLALTAGTLKEGIDAMGFGNPSWRDFTWDVAGTLVGLGIAYAVDSLVRSSPPAPAPVSASRRSGVEVWRF